jgi:hypothetical protein
MTTLCGVAVLILTVDSAGYGQSLGQKLLQKTTFVPKSTSAVEQLLEVARHYEIPMGIEWAEPPKTEVSPLPVENQTTVQGLVDEILRGIPGYRSETDNGVLHISNPTLEADPRNFLNLGISEFAIRNGSVFDADAILKLKIEMAIHAERYVGGWNGGYGSPRGHILDTNNVTFSGRNLTVREILNKIVTANGNALWLTRLVPSKMMQNDPFFATYPDESGESPGFHWQFVPLVMVKNAK